MATPFENYLNSMGFNVGDLSFSAYSDLSNQFNTYGPTQSGIRSQPTSMMMPTMSDAVPISESLGITFNNLPQNSPMRTDTRIVPEEYGLEPSDYGESEEMVSGKTKDSILSKLNPMNALGFLTNAYTGGGMKQALTASGLGELFSKIAEAGRNTPNYQYRTPGYQGRLTASDFYDPKTGLNRFDRAKTLFGQSRTMKEFLDKLKDKRAAAAAKLADARRAIAEDRYGGDPTYDEGQQAGMGFGGGRTDPTDKS